MASNITLQRAVDEYLASLGGVSESLRGNSKVYLGQFVTVTGNVLLHNLKEHHVRAYFYGNPAAEWEGLATRLAPNSYNNARAKLIRFFAWCQEVGYLRRPMITKLTVPKQKEERRPKAQLRPAELLAALDSAPPADRAVLACAINTGLRTKELAGLRLRDVDLESGVIYVEVAKGNKRDHMPITSDLDVELRRWLAWYTEWAKDRHLSSCQRLTKARTCAARHHAEPLCPDWYLLPPGTFHYQGEGLPPLRGLKPDCRHTRLLAVANRALIRAGVKEMVGGKVVAGQGEGMHLFRRSAAQALFEAASADDLGKDQALLVTKEFLHHESVTTTQLYLNMNAARESRDNLLKGRSFLHPSADDSCSVTRLDRGTA